MHAVVRGVRGGDTPGVPPGTALGPQRQAVGSRRLAVRVAGPGTPPGPGFDRGNLVPPLHQMWSPPICSTPLDKGDDHHTGPPGGAELPPVARAALNRALVEAERGSPRIRLADWRVPLPMWDTSRPADKYHLCFLWHPEGDCRPGRVRIWGPPRRDGQSQRLLDEARDRYPEARAALATHAEQVAEWRAAEARYEAAAQAARQEVERRFLAGELVEPPPPAAYPPMEWEALRGWDIAYPGVVYYLRGARQEGQFQVEIFPITDPDNTGYPVWPWSEGAAPRHDGPVGADVVAEVARRFPVAHAALLDYKEKSSEKGGSP